MGTPLPHLARSAQKSIGRNRPVHRAGRSAGVDLRAVADALRSWRPGFGAPFSQTFLLHWLGTDELGRDTLSRILYGGRITLGMVIIVVAIVAPLGLLIGCVAGYAGGWVDRLLMRVTDIFLAFPRLILALAFVAALRPGIESAILAIALTAWPPYARLARAETMQVRGTDYIAACRLTGATSARIVLRHIMPLCVPSLVVRITLDMSSIIITAASLGFLGMGAQPPSPEWGAMIATARRFLFSEWWVPLIPAIAIFVTSLAFNFLGDGLRDVLDPKEQ